MKEISKRVSLFVGVSIGEADFSMDTTFGPDPKDRDISEVSVKVRYEGSASADQTMDL